MKRRSITKRVGDCGRTRTASGALVWKNDPRPAACGEVDELVSVLGVARCHAKRRATRDALLRIQKELFKVGAEVSGLEQGLGAGEVAWLDAACRKLEARIVMPKGFILPGANLAGAHLDHARAVARRCERSIVALSRRRLVRNPNLIVWMNRLSNYLWLLARSEDGAPQLLKES